MKKLMLLAVVLPASVLAQSSVQLQFTNTLPATIVLTTSTDSIYLAPGATLDLSQTYTKYNVDSLLRSLSAWMGIGALTSPTDDPIGDLYKLTPVTYGNFGLPYSDGGGAFVTDSTGNLTLQGNLTVNNAIFGPGGYGLNVVSQSSGSQSGLSLVNDDGLATHNPYAFLSASDTMFEVGKAGGGGVFSAGLINYNTTSIGPDGGYYLTNSCVFGQWEAVSGDLLSCMNADGSEMLAQGAWKVDSAGSTAQSGSATIGGIKLVPVPDGGGLIFLFPDAGLVKLTHG